MRGVVAVSRHGGSSIVLRLTVVACLGWALAGCAPTAENPSPCTPSASASVAPSSQPSQLDIFHKPLVSGIYTADPSAHVFDGKLYVYTSHDLDTNRPDDQLGGQYDMEDYHVLSLTDMHSGAVDLGEILNVKDVPWAVQQMWAPDAAFKNGTYYLYFPAKDDQGIFRIGVATSSSPAGPFVAEKDPIPGSFSIDPAVFVDDDGQAYMYFGGLWGGQLEKWQSGSYDALGAVPAGSQKALGPRVARLSDDMLSFDGPVGEVTILDGDGQPVIEGDINHHFFEGPWVHKYEGTYYLSYSVGEAQYMAYATSDNPLGPFTFRGYLLPPVQGWTTHGSIVEFQGQWYLFYHDASLSHIDHKRCAKVAPLTYKAGGTIQEIKP
jgi:beta-xylosidase